MIATLVSLYVWTVAGLYLLLLQPVLLGLVVFGRRSDPNRLRPARLFRTAGHVLIGVNPLWKFSLDLRRAPTLPGPCVVVCNHESDADVFLSTKLPWDLKYLSKETIYDLPVMGWGMKLAGDVRLVRGDKDSARAAMETCRTWLDRGVSVIIFPEGTRSVGDEMLPFREGAFRLAIEAGVPVQPLVVAGTRQAMAKGSIVFGRARAVMRSLEPMPTTGLDPLEAETFAARVREVIARARAALREELRLSEAD